MIEKIVGFINDTKIEFHATGMAAWILYGAVAILILRAIYMRMT